MIISKKPTDIIACLLPVTIPRKLQHLDLHPITRLPLSAVIAMSVGEDECFFLSLNVEQENALGDYMVEQGIDFNEWTWIDWEKS